MNNSFSTSRKDNHTFDINGIDSNYTPRHMENSVHRYFMPSIESNKVILQWEESDNFLSEQRNSFYLNLGKRVLDILITLGVIIFVLSWLFPIISLFVFLDSRGPIFFLQPRTGHKGTTFYCIKFRTMYQGKPTAEFKQTSSNDSRVTKVGRFLRRTNLDELPQFINVLFGSMSIVGPRPHAVQHDAFHWASPTYRTRYSIKPGITGLAQVRGARGETDVDQKMEHRVRYDLFYARRQSFSLDARIFFQTITTMIKGDKNAW